MYFFSIANLCDKCGKVSYTYYTSSTWKLCAVKMPDNKGNEGDESFINYNHTKKK